MKEWGDELIIERDTIQFKERNLSDDEKLKYLADFKYEINYSKRYYWTCLRDIVNDPKTKIEDGIKEYKSLLNYVIKSENVNERAKAAQYALDRFNGEFYGTITTSNKKKKSNSKSLKKLNQNNSLLDKIKDEVFNDLPKAAELNARCYGLNTKDLCKIRDELDLVQMANDPYEYFQEDNC